ncbi:L-seryl-tRNA(Sec) selenium transferase [Desulfonema limicola]|uniref:L-seryl-tRNA(Sec) selenium transferase n=1 Tax=Desulfonema limicola TaxID=45656 RepID=A0A975B3S4_9BACT|nr:L-seryl-tRNA(Sec) selenium transferase [Desulfonema limicola]QTA78259.1 L-seryl-tRNA(Sec) selenium transferase [Desulfonema limicola]
MNLDIKQQQLLRTLPRVDNIFEKFKNEPDYEEIPNSVLTDSIRKTIEILRESVLTNPGAVTEHTLTETSVIQLVKKQIKAEMSYNLKPLINGTGVVVHTNLGRSLLAQQAIDNISCISGLYSNLEFNLNLGKRGIRYSSIEDILCKISGAEAAMAVNNNAAAVLLCLDTLAAGKQAIVSRGELVEIGGSFRIPDVMAKTGAILKEVGTTNRTHLRDYENAIEADTGLMLKVHTSNYSIVGFTASVSLKELVELGGKHKIPVMEDLGSGTFIDFSKYKMIKEPTVQESVAAGVDIVTFSGDKLLGGPQAGLIVGKKEYLDKIKKNPLTRALRIDKMTLAALEATLGLYRDPEKVVQTIPTLKMLTCSLSYIEQKAVQFFKSMQSHKKISIKILDLSSKVGGGSLPLQEIPSKCAAIEIENISPNALEKLMREHNPPIIGRIENNCFILDFRTIQECEILVIEIAFKDILERREQ